MQHDDFEQWVRNRSRSCMESAEIDEICKGHLDFDSGEYWFFDNAVQAQWEAWQAALCDHKWEVVDDSFDHEYGSEQIVFQRCSLCDAERDYSRPTFDDDVI